MTSVNIALAAAFNVRLLDSSGRYLLTARIEYVYVAVGFRPNKRCSFLTVNHRLQSIIHTVVTTRIILNIRESASRRLDDFSSNLHLSDIGFRALRSRISLTESPAVFRSDGGCESDIF